MAPARRLLPPVLAAVLGLGPLAASAQTPAALRQDLDAVAAALDRAVREVSRPGLFAFSSGSTRAYALPGVGAVFVLPPRALPVRKARVSVDRQTARALAAAISNLEESLERVRTPAHREQLARSLEAVRKARAELLAGRPGAAGEAPVLLDVPLDLGPQLAEVEIEVNEEVARQAHALREAGREAERAGRDARREFQAQWEAQMRALRAQTDAFRREAEEIREQAERALRQQLRMALPEPPEVPEAPEAPEAPEPPGPPAAPPAPPAIAAPPASAAPPAPPVPVLPPPAPWSLWFDLDEGSEGGDADAVVAGVRTAVVHVLEAQAARLARLAPEESAVVAVDFVPRKPGAGPRRTLVWRVHRKDLQERAAGRVAPEEFRRRVYVSEY